MLKATDLWLTNFGRTTTYQPPSIDLRDRFAPLIKKGLSGGEAARRLQVSAATGGRLACQIRECGSAPVAPSGHPRGTGKLAACVVFFKELVERGPDITLFELQDALACAHGVSARHSTIAVLLKRLGFTQKIAGYRRTSAQHSKAVPPGVDRAPCPGDQGCS